jgi:hypothetical protein
MCIGGERKNVDTIMNTYNIQNRFAKDPIDLGGHGKPGLNCPNCDTLNRAIGYLDPVKAETDDRYCRVAVAGLDEVEVFQADGKHCNKRAVAGQPLAYAQFGFPLSTSYFKELQSLLITLKNNGVYEEKKESFKPESSCPSTSNGTGARSLTPYDLVGIWITCGGFVIIGLIVSFVERRKAMKESAKAVAKGSVRVTHLVKDSLRMSSHRPEVVEDSVLPSSSSSGRRG